MKSGTRNAGFGMRLIAGKERAERRNDCEMCNSVLQGGQLKPGSLYAQFRKRVVGGGRGWVRGRYRGDELLTLCLDVAPPRHHGARLTKLGNSPLPGH